jgi:hypothetical protein
MSDRGCRWGVHLTLKADQLDRSLGVSRAGLPQPSILAGERVSAGVDDHPNDPFAPSYAFELQAYDVVGDPTWATVR